MPASAPGRSVVLATDPTVAQHARAFVGRALADLGRGDLAPVASLLVSELVTNVVRHTDEPSCTVTLGPSALGGHPIPDPSVVVAVGDAAADLTVRSGPLPDRHAESGRGLRIVASLADDWGVRRGAEEKAVWFQLGR